MNRVEVLLPKPFDHGFDYRVPDGMQLGLGDVVSVPFGRNTVLGVVWGEGTQDIPAEKCKAILTRYEVPPLSKEMRTLVDWVAAYNMAEKGSVLKMALPLPKAITQPTTQTVYQIGAQAEKLTPKRQQVIDQFQNRNLIPRDRLLELSGVSSAVIHSMVKGGQLIGVEQAVAARPRRYIAQTAPELSAEQKAAADAINRSLGQGFHPFLLDGVTGSGKTEVYFETIEAILETEQGQILVLLPEIALTTQWMVRFERRFGNKPYLWHSSVSISERKRTYNAIQSGAARLVVGARSALFLPYKDLRLIIIDEEHESSYKQEDGVLYHARDMGVARAKIEQIPIVLVSATPSLETVCNAQQGKYTELKLSERHGRFDYPDVSLIDLRQDKAERGCWISPTLREAVQRTLTGGHQAMLFLNRRGYAPLVLCRHCGHRIECPNCSSWMVMHHRPPRLQCHHCDTRMPIPTECPECHEPDQLIACGPGVERLEEEVREWLPEANIITLSSDDDNIDASILGVLEQKADIIIGTQLVAKGHHFPHLALVGVIDADLGLHGGDVRASERTYQLLHQLAGRAGREAVAGEVYLQTTQPEHPVMQALADGDREAFMALELEQRSQMRWPPFGRLAALILDGANELTVAKTARMLVQSAPRYDNVSILGPAPAPLSRLRNQYRYRLLVKTPRETHIQKLLQTWLGPIKLPSSVRLKIDIDPYNFL